jgi:hypothetical protein
MKQWIEWLGGIGLFSFIAAMFAVQGRKMDKLVKQELCNQKYSEVCRRLERGESKFDCMDSKLDKIKEIVIRIDTKLKMIEDDGK